MVWLRNHTSKGQLELTCSSSLEQSVGEPVTVLLRDSGVLQFGYYYHHLVLNPFDQLWTLIFPFSTNEFHKLLVACFYGCRKNTKLRHLTKYTPFFRSLIGYS